MTFIEALKTGRPMRRESWWRGDGGARWLVLEAEDGWSWVGGGHANPPTRRDLLAEDWQVTP